MDGRRPLNDRKRSFSSSEGHDFGAKRLTVDVPGKKTSSKSGFGGGQTSSYPASSLYHSPSQRDAEVSNGTYSSLSRRPSSGNRMGPVRLSKRDMEGSGFPYDTRLPEEGYPGQYDLQQAGNVSRRDYDLEMPSRPSYSSSLTKRNRFNLSRYQLGDDEDIFASIPATDPEEKPNKFKTQRERIMLVERDEKSEETSDSGALRFDETSFSNEDADSSSESQSHSQDSYMSQRERLRRFSSEQARHVAIPNEWEGETKLQEFVAFGNIEAALRPLDLMMARAALVSDSVKTRHLRRSTSSGPSCCGTSLSNSLTL